MFNEIQPARVFYFAYGSNMSRRQMRQRCPSARFNGAALLQGWTLKERLFADIDRRKGAMVHGVAWEVTERCVRSLDIYEGVSCGLYQKEKVSITLENGSNVKALVYQETPQAKVERNNDAFTLSYVALCAESAIECKVPVAPVFKRRLRAYGKALGKSVNIHKEALGW